MEDNMTSETKRSLHDKVINYKQLDEAFSRIIKGVEKVLSGCEETIFKPKENNQFIGFGQTVQFSWRFIIVDGLPYGKLSVSHSINDHLHPFFIRYFKPDGNIYSKPGLLSSVSYPTYFENGIPAKMRLKVQ